VKIKKDQVKQIISYVYQSISKTRSLNTMKPKNHLKFTREKAVRISKYTEELIDKVEQYLLVVVIPLSIVAIISSAIKFATL
tara:strand:- start:472 stop:717 length:246 start_codon:yes stop_codon:yes gene_type:complete